MKNRSLYILIAATTILLAACSPESQTVTPKIQSIATCPEILVYADTTLVNDLPLPQKVDVTYDDGSTAELPITWDVASLSGKPLQESATLLGKVEGTELQAKLQVVVLSRTAPLPSLTASELSSADVAALMDLKLKADKRMEQITWSPTRTAASFTFTVREESPLYIWTVGEAAPAEVMQQKHYYHHLAWSYDGSFLAVHIDPSLGEHRVMTIHHPSLKRSKDFHIIHETYWSPDSNELLMAAAREPIVVFLASYATNLVLYDAETGEMRILMEANADTMYTPTGWQEPGEALYTKVIASGPPNARQFTTEENLVVKTRP